MSNQKPSPASDSDQNRPQNQPGPGRDIAPHDAKQSETTDLGNTQPPGNSSVSARNLSGQFGRYSIKKILGQGGMGAVYLGEDSQLDRLVAIKVPFFDPADQQSVLDRGQIDRRPAPPQHLPDS